MPGPALRVMAGYGVKEQYHLVRGRVEPPASLHTQIFPWVDFEIQKLEAKREQDEKGARPTALAFLKFLKAGRRIILQDAAALMIQDGNRKQHELFKMGVFKTDEFQVSRSRLIVVFHCKSSHPFSFLQTHTLVMEQALMRAQSTDTHRKNIDLGLHGVNGRFDNMEKTMDRKFGEQKTEMYNIVKKVFEESSTRTRQEFRSQVANSLTAAANELLREQGEGGRNESTEQDETRPAATARRQETRPGYGYRMTSIKGSNTVLSIYKEWFGVGAYEMIPIPGGVAALEQMYKAKWRKSYSAGEQREFSRVSNVIKAIEKRRSDGEELGAICSDLTQYYYSNGRYNLTGLVKVCQEEGWIGKRKRNRA
jgi:hypothetical protein